MYEQLKRDVSDFKLVPGDRFTETDISERLGVSPTPLRQALFRLQQEGFVEVLFWSGWRVLPFDFDRFEEPFELRQLLETIAAHRLCGATAHTLDASQPALHCRPPLARVFASGARPNWLKPIWSRGLPPRGGWRALGRPDAAPH